jgi:hypothetical protein
MLKSISAATVLTASVLMATTAAATTIEFDDGTAGSAVGATYAAQGVTFSNTLFVSNFGFAGSTGPLGISATNNYLFGPDNPIVGAFSSAQTSLGIRGIGVGASGIRLEAYDASNALIAFDQFFGTGAGGQDNHDLFVSVAGIASFRLFQPLTVGLDSPFGDGVLFDSLSFSAATAGAVPEPATWAMMLAGFALVGGVLRRRRQPKVRFAF